MVGNQAYAALNRLFKIEYYKQKFINFEPWTLRAEIIKEPFSKKCDILGTKNEKKNENLWFSVFFKNTVLKITDIQVLKNSTLHHKISRLGGGGLPQ